MKDNYISAIQSMCLASVKSESNKMLYPTLKVPFDCNQDFSSLGESGEVIKKFFSDVDITHPDVYPHVVGLPNWGTFINDVDLVTRKCPDKHDDQVKIAYHRINSNETILSRLKIIMARFCNSKDRLRSNKNRIINISLKQSCVTGENGFYSNPDNFKSYVRFDKSYIEEISNLKRKQSFFLQTNMVQTARSFGSRIKRWEEVEKNSFIGFRRLTPVNASIILARLHGFKWNEARMCLIPYNYFSGIKFWNSDNEEPDIKKIKGKSSYFELGGFSYQPRIYPLNLFNSSMPKKTEEIINSVENFLDYGGKSIFDYYWVVVPSIDINHHTIFDSDRWRLKFKDNFSFQVQQRVFDDELSVINIIDNLLTTEGYIMPVVLGERNGMCYFVCLWA